MSRIRAPIIGSSFPSEARRGQRLAHVGVRALERHSRRATGEEVPEQLLRREGDRSGEELYEAIAERFLLEGADFRAWR